MIVIVISSVNDLTGDPTFERRYVTDHGTALRIIDHIELEQLALSEYSRPNLEDIQAVVDEWRKLRSRSTPHTNSRRPHARSFAGRRHKPFHPK